MKSKEDADRITVGNIENSQGVAIGERATAIVGYTAEQVSALLMQIGATFQPKPFDGRSPYVGLAAFEESDADRFFGREKLVAEIVARVDALRSRAIFIAGPSGSGKSSLMRAGVMHALKAGALAKSETWLYETMQPGRAPLDELGRVVSRWANSVKAGDEFRGSTNDAAMFHRWADIALGDARDRRAIMLVDQFEEIFTQVASEAERVAFLNLLTHAATIQNGRMTILFALRSDFVSHCAAYPQLNALLNQQFLQVGAMQPDELVSAIAQPALRVGLRIDPDLIAQIVNEMRDALNALPLMQFALDDLFNAQPKRSVIALTLNDYLTRGGLHKALERHADAAFAHLDAGQQQIARMIFAGVIEIGRGTVDTRRTAVFAELVPAGANIAAAQAVVQKLADARLIATDEREGKETVTLAHERLIDAWQWLRRLVNENREQIALQNKIAEDARTWDANARDASYLYTGARLATAREQLDAKKISLSGLAQKFLEVGIRANEAERRARQRRVRVTIVGLATALLVFIALAFVAFQQGSVATSRELAASAISNLSIDPELSVLLAMEGVRTAHTAQAEEALRQSLPESHVRATMRGHTGVVNAATFSPNGHWLVTASSDGTARIWDVATAKNTVELHGHSGPVISAAFSPDGSRVVTASIDESARVWDAVTGQTVIELRGSAGPVYNATYSPDGRWILTKNGDKSVSVWDATTGSVVTQLRGYTADSYVFNAGFSPDGKLVVAGMSDNTTGLSEMHVWEAPLEKNLAEFQGSRFDPSAAIFSPDAKFFVTNHLRWTALVWEIGSGNLFAETGVHNNSVNTVRFSPNGRFIVTASDDGTARIWEASTGRIVKELRGHTSQVRSAFFSPDGKYIVTAGDLTARIWDASTGQELVVLRGHTDAVTSAMFSPDGKAVVTASRDKTVRIWEYTPTFLELRGHSDWVRNPTFSPDGKLVLTSSLDDTARVWETATGRLVVELGTHADDGVYYAEFSRDGKSIVTAGLGTARVWDVSTGKVVAELRGHESSVFDAEFSTDGIFVVTASADKTARVWESRTGRSVSELRGHTDEVNSASLSPDGQLVVTASNDGTARVWEAHSGNLIAELRGHKYRVLRAIFSPNGKFIVTTGDSMPRLWNVSTLSTYKAGTADIVTELQGHTSLVYNAAFSPDSKYVVTASGDSTARIWETSTGRSVAELRGHTSTVFDATFSPDGKFVVTASNDRTVRVWEAKTGHSIEILSGHTLLVSRSRFSPDSKSVVTASDDRTARIYACNACYSLDDLLALARTLVTRELTCEERVQYLHEEKVCPTPTP